MTDTTPFPQYAAAAFIGVTILAVYFTLCAVTVAQFRRWWIARETRRALDDRHGAPRRLG